ncbi:hypothetical protein [Blastococcus sp. SYSU D00695]
MAVQRRVRAAALLLVAASVLVRAWLVAGRGLFSDDLKILHRADTSPLLSPAYLFQDYDGQFMPGSLLVAGVVERLGRLDWWPAATTIVVLQVLASLALLRLLRLLVGDRPLLLVPLAFGLFTPLTLGSVTWWAAALNSLPLQIGLATFLAEAVQAARTGGRRHALRGAATLAGTLLFYLKAVLLPGLGVAVAALVLLRDGERTPLATTWRRGRPLWLGSLAVTAVWAVAYLVTRSHAPVAGGGLGDLAVTVLTGWQALLTAAVGGPFGWVGGAPQTPYARIPWWSVVAGALVVVAACVTTCRRSRGAGLVWALVAAEVTVGLVLAAAGRGALGLGHLLPLAARYYAVEAVLLPVAGALLATLPVTGRAPAHAAIGPARRPVVATAAATAAFVVVALLSTLQHARAWQTDRTGAYLAAARESLAAAGDTPVLDQRLPGDVLWPLLYPDNLLSHALSPLEDLPPVADWTPDLRMLDDDGHLRPAGVVAGPRVTPGPVPGCGWPVRTGTAVPLATPLFDWEWTAEVTYVADRDGELTVALPSGEPVRVEVTAGRHTVWVRLSGDGRALRVTPQTPGLQLCVAAGRVGDAGVR